MAKGRVKLQITFEALAVVSNMRYRCNLVSELYGEHSPEHVFMLRSLMGGLAHVLEHGGKVVPYDVDPALSLIGGNFVVWRLVFVKADGRALVGQWVFYR